MMEDGRSPIDDFILGLTGVERPRICFISTASGDLPEHLDRFYAAFDRRRSEPSHLAFFRKPTAGAVRLAGFGAHLAAQDVIFVGGGNTRSALAVWREWRLDVALRAAFAAGVLLSGVSAGALCWFELGLSDSWNADYRPVQGLGFLPGGCATHYGANPAQKRALFAAVETGEMPPSVAISDYAAVLYRDGVLERAIRWREGAAAYRVAREGSAVRATPLDCEELGSAADQ